MVIYEPNSVSGKTRTESLIKEKGLAILGGTFDPIHMGHIACAEEILETFSLEKIKLIPCSQTPHRPQPLNSASSRCKLISLAIEDLPRLELDKRECNRAGLSYTIDTLRSVREELSKDTPLYFLLGMDAFSKINEWYQWEEILELCHLIVINRPEYKAPSTGPIAALISAHQSQNIEKIQQASNGKIYFHQMNDIHISSTEIRSALKSKQDISAMLPKKVWTELQKRDQLT